MVALRPMLASKIEVEQIKFPMLAQPKLDGFRALIVKGELVSRNLKPIVNPDVFRLYSSHEFEGFDGELIIPDHGDKNAFQKTSSIVTTLDKPVSKEDIQFCVFDLWDMPEETYTNRFKNIKSRLKLMNKPPQFKLIPTKIVSTVEELLDFERRVLACGYEGIILRRTDSPYKYGRSTTKQGYLLKLKRFVDDEAIIIGFEERMHNANEATINKLGYTERSTKQGNKKPMGTLGAFKVRDRSGREFHVGTGLTDSQRQEIWNKREDYINKIIKFQHFAGAGVLELPRFPSFKGFRDVQDCESF